MRKQVVVSADSGETRVALLEAEDIKPGGSDKRSSAANQMQVAELYIERRGDRSIVGNIYKGRVANVLPGLEAAFVDIGLDKNGFLHVDEIVLPGVETQRRGHGKGGLQISDLLKVGQEIVVQVVKDPLKTKGARLSMEVTIAGRYMVFVPTGDGLGVSRRLDDRERERLRKEIRNLDLRGGGAIIRTAAEGAKRIDFEREILYLQKLNEVLQKRVAEQSAPSLVFQEADLPIRVVRDIAAGELERAVLDDKEHYDRLVSFFQRTAPELCERVELYKSDKKPLFSRYGVDKAIEGVLSRRVDLPSGGYIVFDYAEALTVIDINTGSFIGKGRAARLEDTISQTNLEAAAETVRQLRLRDVGGIIVIDFIDMARARNRDAVLKTLRRELEKDRTKTYVVEISPLGLVEMTRQNVTDGMREILTHTCPTCHGEGVVLSSETVALNIKRELKNYVKNNPEPEAFLVQVNARVKRQYSAANGRLLKDLEAETGKVFHFDGSEGSPLDHFAVVLEGSVAKVSEHALPFNVGDEVLVEVLEPHMFRDNDAVAKIDGYIVTVLEGNHVLGQKQLVKIESVDRVEAVASLVEAVGSKQATSGDSAPANSVQSPRSSTVAGDAQKPEPDNKNGAE